MRCAKAKRSVSLAQDGRLEPVAMGALQDHLRSCPSCRDWRDEQAWLQALVASPPEIPPSSGFQAGVMARIAGAPRRLWPIAPPAPFPRPALLRAAAVLAFVVSALFGYFIATRLDAAAPPAGTAAFNQALNLDAFADLPGDSFGAVYERLLQEEVR